MFDQVAAVYKVRRTARNKIAENLYEAKNFLELSLILRKITNKIGNPGRIYYIVYIPPCEVINAIVFKCHELRT